MVSIFVVDNKVCSSTIQREHTVAFPWQQWIHERAIMLQYKYICLSCLFAVFLSPLLRTNECFYQADWQHEITAQGRLTGPVLQNDNDHSVCKWLKSFSKLFICFCLIIITIIIIKKEEEGEGERKRKKERGKYKKGDIFLGYGWRSRFSFKILIQVVWFNKVHIKSCVYHIIWEFQR